MLLGESKTVTKPILITQKLRELSKKNPRKTFIYYDKYEITYELFYRNCLLIKKWIIGNNYNSRKVPIVIISEKSPLLIKCVLGILMSGTPYNIIDMNYPKKRIELFIDTLKPKIIFNLCNYNVENLDINVDFNIIFKTLSYNYDLGSILGVNITDDMNDDDIIDIGDYDICSYSFTSGTEGKPKVVEGIYGSLTY